MKKLNKKGFTIVELVIVIAVIAILAAVLIPTFTIVVKKANDSAALQALDTAKKEYMTMVDATADDFADFNTKFAYKYTVDKNGQKGGLTEDGELAGLYKYDGEGFTKIAETGYAQVFEVSGKYNAFDDTEGAKYYDIYGQEQTIGDEAAFKGYNGALYSTKGDAVSIQGVLVYIKVA